MKIAIIGAGHNGLVCGAYLAKAGFDVTILERRDEVGGMCVTEELLPGFKVSSAACWFGMLRSEIIDDLNLSRFGLETYPANPQTFLPYPDGSFFVSTLNPVETKESLKRLSPSDVKNWDKFWQDVFRAVEIIKPYLIKPPVDKREITNAISFLGCSLFDVSVLEFLNRYFISDKVKIPLATLSLAVRYGTPQHAGTLFNFLYMLTAETNGIPGAWGFAKGGMGSVTKALKGVAEAYGVKIITGKVVRSILIKNGKAVGIITEDGSENFFDLIISNVDPTTTFIKLIGIDDLPYSFAQKVKGLDTSGASVAIHISLSGLPSFSKWESLKNRLNGITLIAPSFDYIRKSYLDFKNGVLTDSPIMTFSIPSITDPSVAPSGKHLLSMYAQYASPAIRWTESTKKKFFANIVHVLEQYSPGFRDLIEDWVLLSPDDFENIFGVYAGNHEHIQMMPSQLFDERPVVGYNSYRTPINHLYICGAGTHPGGTVTGVCGYNCAQIIIEEFGKNRRDG